MSAYPDFEPLNTESDPDSVEMVIVPRARDLGGFEVRRALPYVKRRMVGPFIFFDQMGPAQFSAGKGIDVRPHPHIGLATVTYLFDGTILHRDSLGSVQEITPGAVNWMIAGRGITHSERSPDAFRADAAAPLFGIQTWVALPTDKEDMAPAFDHHTASDLPVLTGEGKTARIILGTAYGAAAPVNVQSDTLYVDVQMAPGAKLPLPMEHEDRGAYVVSGELEVGGVRHDTAQMLVFRPGDAVTLVAGAEGARVMLFGGATMDGPRHIWWNLVSSSQEKIEHAKEEWRRGNWDEGLFSLPPGDEDEHIPLPA